MAYEEMDVLDAAGAVKKIRVDILPTGEVVQFTKLMDSREDGTRGVVIEPDGSLRVSDGHHAGEDLDNDWQRTSLVLGHETANIYNGTIGAGLEDVSQAFELQDYKAIAAFAKIASGTMSCKLQVSENSSDFADYTAYQTTPAQIVQIPKTEIAHTIWRLKFKNNGGSSQNVLGWLTKRRA